MREVGKKKISKHSMSGGDCCYGENQNRIRGGQAPFRRGSLGEGLVRGGPLLMFDRGPGGSEAMSEAGSKCSRQREQHEQTCGR